MRYLAIDLGDKRTGLAVGEDESGIATPLSVIETGSPIERDRQLDRAIDDEQPDALVVGLPLNMDGTEGPRAKLVRDFGAQLGQRTGLKVHFTDERLTSDAADELMARSGLTHQQKKMRRDALAAAVFLQAFLDRKGSD